jgi:hypothetical protein
LASFVLLQSAQQRETPHETEKRRVGGRKNPATSKTKKGEQIK